MSDMPNKLPSGRKLLNGTLKICPSCGENKLSLAENKKVFCRVCTWDESQPLTDKQYQQGGNTFPFLQAE